MTEPLQSLLERTETALRAKVARCRSSNSTDQLVLNALEGAAGQLEDRADQCASWTFNVERWGARLPKDREAEMRAACAEFMRMCGHE